MVWFLFSVLVLYFLAILGVAACFVYPFRSPIFVSPGFLGCPQEDIEFMDSGSGLPLRGWWVPHSDPEIVFICCHGYMMNRAELAPMAAGLRGHSAAFMFFDFPAHGRSAGRKSSIGPREASAVSSAVLEARKRHPLAKIVLIGSSMGAAASAFAVSNDPGLADALILDSCYDRLSDASAGWWVFLAGQWLRILLAPVVLVSIPLSGVNPYKVVVSRALATVTIPTLVLHGGADVLAPISQAESNFAGLRGPKKMVVFPGRNHSEARWEDSERYFAEIKAFLGEHGLSEPG